MPLCKKTFVEPINVNNSWLNCLEDIRKGEEVRDIKIQTSGGTVNAHRVILAMRLPFIRKQLSENSPNMKNNTWNWPMFSQEAVEALIEYVYKGGCTVTERNVYQIYLAAKALELESVMNWCMEFIKDGKQRFSLGELFQFASFNNLFSLENYCMERIAQSFETMFQSPLLGTMDSGQLRSLLARDDLVVDSECRVYEAILDWVRVGSKRMQRASFLPDLLNTIRWTQMPLEYIERVIMDNKHVKNNACLIEYLNNVLKRLDKPEERIYCESTINMAPRNRNHEIFGVGVSEKVTKSAMCIASFDTLTGLPIPLGQVEAQHDSAVVFADDQLFVIGGRKEERKEVTKDILCYDVRRRQISRRGLELSTPRMKACAVYIEPYIYVIGGVGADRNVLNSVEVITKTDFKAYPLPNCRLTTPRCAAAAVNAESLGIVVLGGWNYSWKWGQLTMELALLRSVETVMNRDKITKLPSMLWPRAFHSAWASDCRIFAVGGRSEVSEFSCEMYAYDRQDPYHGKWTELTRAKPGASIKTLGFGFASDFVLDEIRGRDFFFLIVVAPRGEIIELGECEHSEGQLSVGSSLYCLANNNSSAKCISLVETRLRYEKVPLELCRKNV